MTVLDKFLVFFFFKQKTAYEIASCLVGSEMCIRDRTTRVSYPDGGILRRWYDPAGNVVKVCSLP